MIDLDTATGNMVAKNEFFKGGEQNGQPRKYYNQPTIAKIGENQFALMAIESNGTGKNTNIKGSNVAIIE